MTQIAPRSLADFEGAWRFSREVRHASGDIALVLGQAVFVPTPGGLLYEENGEMSINGGAPMLTSRIHLWSPNLDVHFEDGRAFHAVPASGGQAEHWCAPDMYKVAYEFAQWPIWHSVWDVSGPNKAYTMETTYTRFTDAA